MFPTALACVPAGHGRLSETYCRSTGQFLDLARPDVLFRWRLTPTIGSFAAQLYVEMLKSLYGKEFQYLHHRDGGAFDNPPR